MQFEEGLAEAGGEGRGGLGDAALGAGQLGGETGQEVVLGLLRSQNGYRRKYAEELVKRMQQSGAKAYLVNTGWNGTGKRISIKDTRGIIDAILDGSIKTAPTKTIPYFNFEVPTELPGVDPKILDPRDTYADAAEWDAKAKDLAARFTKNFTKYTTNDAGKALVAAGPKAD